MNFEEEMIEEFEDALNQGVFLGDDVNLASNDDGAESLDYESCTEELPNNTEQSNEIVLNVKALMLPTVSPVTQPIDYTVVDIAQDNDVSELIDSQSNKDEVIYELLKIILWPFSKMAMVIFVGCIWPISMFLCF